MVVSTAATTTLEDVAAAGGEAPRWYQLYWPNDPDLAASFLERAAAAGYRALVLTLDTHTMGWRPRDLDNAFLPFLRAVGNQNYLADPVFLRAVGERSTTRIGSRRSNTGLPSSGTRRSPGTTSSSCGSTGAVRSP
jgi:L-lactate dehydrogenase (cytochrome)